jgi:hypothetical protein
LKGKVELSLYSPCPCLSNLCYSVSIYIH